ncbi:tripartite motif containing 39 L homeolog isoform X1 [Xenopus laevis]|uniref:Tripartite motif containing 39 L homeolog isoform X1 n=3 Tax=Xenopus laevis TaxID=8355 RepID=A0A8J0UEL2_XENLA|nr:tripartite motif containing 39 L homeolog isoform X1 [Xenopus laevis]
MQAMAAANRNPVTELKEELTCPICLDHFSEPVSIECGHSFCRTCINRSWRGIHSYFECPQCRNVSRWKFLRPNRLVENMVEITERLAASKISPVSKKQCEKHQEPMKLYCQVDGREICLVCRESVEHRTHTVIPVEESTREFKVQLRDRLQTLRKEAATIIQTKSEDKQKVEKLQKEIEKKRRMLASEFEILREILNDRERELKDRFEVIEKLIIQRTNEKTSKLNEKLSSLQKLIMDIEQNVLPPSQIYEEPKSAVGRLSQNLSDPQQKPSHGGTMPATFALKRFTVPVTLDHKTANPNLIISGNRKIVRYEEYPKNLVNYPERFDMKPCVLGSTGYRSGKRYWEVEVGGGIYWSVGVAAHSVCRKGPFKIEPSGGIWAIGLLGMYTDRYYAFTSPDILLHPRDRPVVVGVFLNCDEQRVSFFNADSFEHLHTFNDVHSADKIFPFFCVGAMGTELRLDI